jgi:site-specific DNA-methyltransferase (cytosine-N4-specific)
MLTDENDSVLDPFAGSKTTGYVAELLKRRWVSIEIDPSFVRSSMGRFDNIIIED